MMIEAMTFVVVLAICTGAYWFFVVRPEHRFERSLARRLRTLRHRQGARMGRLLKDVRAMSTVGPLDAALRGSRGPGARLERLIEQSGTNTSVARLLLSCGCLALLTFLLVWHYTGWVLLAIPTAACVGLLPIAVLRRKRSVRLRTFEEQFPEALDLLSRALRAGHSFITAIEMVAEEMPRPLGPEFKLLHGQQNYGRSLPDALRELAQRVPILDARFFVTAVLIQRESGGNLAEVLDNLAGVMRDRFRVKRQMRVVSAHGRITGWILVALPPALGTVLMMINPDHRTTMFGDPLGQQMLIGGFVLQVIGTFIIRKIVNVEY
jgi:tight adherence protein B